MNTLLALQQIFVANVAYNMANMRLPKTHVPTLQDTIRGIPAIQNFGMNYVVTPLDERGEQLRNKIPAGKIGISQQYYDWVDNQTSSALALMKTIKEADGDMKTALYSVYAERTSRAIELPAPPEEESYADFTGIKAMRDFIAYKLIFPATMMATIVNGSSGNHGTFNNRSNILAEDVQKAIELELLPYDESGFDPVEVDHIAEDQSSWDIESLLDTSDVIRLDSVEYEKATDFQHQARVWYKWLIALNGQAALDDQVENTRDRARDFVKTQQASNPFHGQKKAAAPAT